MIGRQALLITGSSVALLAAGGTIAAVALTPSSGSTIKHVKQTPAAVVQQVQAPTTATSASSPARVVSSSVTVHPAAIRPADVQDPTTDSPAPVVTPPTAGVTTEPNGQASPTSWPTLQPPPQSPVGSPSGITPSPGGG